MYWLLIYRSGRRVVCRAATLDAARSLGAGGPWGEPDRVVPITPRAAGAR